MYIYISNTFHLKINLELQNFDSSQTSKNKQKLPLPPWFDDENQTTETKSYNLFYESLNVNLTAQ